MPNTKVKSPSRTKTADPALMDLFVDELKDIYWAEKHLVKSLPKLRKAAHSEQLGQAIDEHLEETRHQVERLEKVFETLGKPAKGKKCDAMEGLVAEAESVISETEKGTATRDVGIIVSAQKAEHYEIASYGSLVQLAKVLGEDKVADLLAQTLEEEKMADEKLTEIAVNGVNYEANEEN